MEIKYRDQYNEYCYFFKELNENHPAVKDLTKTSTFKKWKKRQLNCVESETETRPTESFEAGEIAEEIDIPNVAVPETQPRSRTRRIP